MIVAISLFSKSSLFKDSAYLRTRVALKHTVEIDECLLVCRKYNVGRMVQEQWVFGGYDVQSIVGFMVPVDQEIFLFEKVGG